MENQDWTPVVFKKKNLSTNIHVNSNNIKKNYQDDDIPEKKKQTEKKEQQSMMQSRIANGYKSQKDLALATKGKINQARINEIESGKGNPPSGFEKTLLFKLLKIKFK